MNKKTRRPGLIIFFAICIFALLIFIFCLKKNAICSAPLEKYANAKYGISLNKPAGWLVQINPPAISLLKDKSGNTSINIEPVFAAHPKMNAITLSSLIWHNLKKTHPNTRLVQALKNKDESLVQFITDFTNENKVEVRGLYLTGFKNGEGIMASYQTPKNTFNLKDDTLRRVLDSLQVNPKIFYSMKGRASSTNLSAGTELTPTISTSNLVMKSSPDGTVFVKCPPNWQVGGGEMYFAAEDPQSGIGVLMRNEYFTGGTHAQYLTNNILAPFGLTNIQVLSDNYNPQAGAGYNGHNIEVCFVSRNGIAGTGYFAVVITPPGPMGYSAITTQGFWAPSSLYQRNFSVLYSIAMSIDINEALVNQKYQQLFARIQQTQKTLAETSDILSKAVDKHMKDVNRIIDKYSDYLAGKQRYYSVLEDKVYRMSYYVGDYPSNPRYPQESMDPVPDDKWEYAPENW